MRIDWNFYEVELSVPSCWDHEDEDRTRYHVSVQNVLLSSLVPGNLDHTHPFRLLARVCLVILF